MKIASDYRILEGQEQAMAVNRGVVKGNTIVLKEPVELLDGTEVVVRPVTTVIPSPSEASEWEREDAFLRYLLEIGMISRIPSRLPAPPGLERTPIEILDGPPCRRRSSRNGGKWPPIILIPARW